MFIEKDIVPGKKVGLNTIWIKGEQWDDKQYDEKLADKVITDFSQLV